MSRMALANSPAPIAAGAGWALIEDGNYEVEVLKAVRTHDRRYGREIAFLLVGVLAEGVQVPCFFNLGNLKDKRRGRLVRGPRSRYYRAWVVAAGRKPRPDEPMDVDVFLGKRFLARIRTCDQDARQDRLSDDLRYSLVEQLLELRGSLEDITADSMKSTNIQHIQVRQGESC